MILTIKKTKSHMLCQRRICISVAMKRLQPSATKRKWTCGQNMGNMLQEGDVPCSSQPGSSQEAQQSQRPWSRQYYGNSVKREERRRGEEDNQNKFEIVNGPKGDRMDRKQKGDSSLPFRQPFHGGLSIQNTFNVHNQQTSSYLCNPSSCSSSRFFATSRAFQSFTNMNCHRGQLWEQKSRYYSTEHRKNSEWDNSSDSVGGQNPGVAVEDKNYDDLYTSGEMCGNPQFSSGKDLGRSWNYVAHRPRSGFQFSVLSYNILADKLLCDNPFLYTSCKDQATLNWNYRRENLIKEIDSYKADIICLQEVQVDHFHDWFESHFNRCGYNVVYKQRSGDKRDGCLIGYKASKFKAIHTHSVEFTRPGVPLMDRNNVAAIVILEPRAKFYRNMPLCIATTHLLFNKKRGDIKLAQLAFLFAEIEKYANLYRYRTEGVPKKGPSEPDTYMPVVLCGDFNSLPFSPLYDFIVKGRLKFEGRSRLHISGQSDSPSRLGTILGKWLLPRELNISHSCKWKLDTCIPEGIDRVKFRGGLDTDPEHVMPSSPIESATRHFVYEDGPSLGRPQYIVRNGKSSTASDDLYYEQPPANFGRLKVQTPTQEHPSSSEWTVALSARRDFQTTTSQDSASKSITEGTERVTPGSDSVNFDRDHDLDEPSNETDGLTECEEVGVLKHTFQFRSVYGHVHSDASREVTTSHSQTAYTVDYVFYSQNDRRHYPQRHGFKRRGRLDLLGYLKLIKAVELQKMGGLPNRYLSSDHVALLASFSLH